MKTLLEHIDDLDRMIEAGNTPTDKLRSQLAFIGREVAALEADYSRLTQDHANLKSAHEKLNAENRRKIDEWLDEEAKKQAEIMKRHSLNYGA